MHIMQQLFQAFTEKGIAYAHFKSNVNLDYSFAGTADFDVLIDKRRLHEAQSILLSLGGRRFNTIPEKVYPGVDNWLLCDPDDGNIYHLHLHCQLATGKPLIKDYVIPWAKLILATRIVDEKYGIYITDPNLEIVLLAARSVVKSHTRVYLKAKLGVFALGKGLRQEHDDLLKIVEPQKVKAYCDKVFPAKYAETACKIILKEKWSGRDYTVLCRIVRETLSKNRRFSPSRSWWLSKTHIFRSKMRARLRYRLDRQDILKKTSEKGGLIIAFIGVDGAGKSTVTKEIEKWLRGQIECKRFYMGTGDGKVNLFTRIIKKLMHAKNDGAPPAPKKRSEGGSQKKYVSFWKNPVSCTKKSLLMLSAFCVEKDNAGKLRKMAQYRLNGGISLLDRFPQKQQEGVNDGPKLCLYECYLGKTGLYKRLIKKEADLFRIVEEIKPDIIFRINISAETSMARKPEQTDIEVYREKIEILNSLTFEGAKIVDINGEQPYEQELMEIKKYIWSCL